MIKNVMLTGGTGFIGRNVSEYLKNKCNLFTPSREELNLFSQDEVIEYIVRNEIQIVIHAANPNPVKNCMDKQEKMFEESMRMFMNLFCAKDYYEFMYSIGSGAEFDKTEPIVSIREEQEFDRVPSDSYGLAKYIMNQMISTSDKHCNLRVFACYGPTDHESKFITHIINCCLNNERVTIRQNCVFDYMHVKDLAKILEYFIYNKPHFHSYNVCSGKRVELLEIAREILDQLDRKDEIFFLSEGMNKEYTGCNERLLQEMGHYEYISLKDGIAEQIKSMRGY